MTIKDVYNYFIKNFSKTLSYSGYMSLFLFLSYIILYLLISNLSLTNFFSLALILITAVLIGRFFVPIFFSYFACNGLIEGNKDISFKEFFRMSRNIRKTKDIYVLNIEGIIIKSFLVFIISLFISFLISYYVGYINSSLGIKVVVDEIIKLVSDTNLTVEYVNSSLINLINIKYYDLIRINSAIIFFVSSFLCLFYFLFKLCRDFNKFFISKYFIFIRLFRLKKLIYKTLKNKKVNYYKDFFKLVLPYFILSSIIFSLSYWLIFIYIKDVSITLLSLTSNMIILMLLLPFLPLIFNLNNIKSSLYLPLFFRELCDSGSVYIKNVLSSNLKGEEKESIEILKNSLETLEKLNKDIENFNLVNNNLDDDKTNEVSNSDVKTEENSKDKKEDNEKKD